MPPAASCAVGRHHPPPVSASRPYVTLPPRVGVPSLAGSSNCAPPPSSPLAPPPSSPPPPLPPHAAAIMPVAATTAQVRIQRRRGACRCESSTVSPRVIRGVL